LSNSERILKVRFATAYPDKEELPMFGRWKEGQLILTNRRLIFIKAVIRPSLDLYDNLEDVEKELGEKDSFAVPLDEIFDVKLGRKLGAPYLAIKFWTTSGRKACSFCEISGILFSRVTPEPWDEWAKLINSLRRK
jgi:hypothetical protein